MTRRRPVIEPALPPGRGAGAEADAEPVLEPAAGDPPLQPATGRSADAVERIVVIATRQLGDVLLTTPLVRAARLRWPTARIDVLGFAGTLGLLRGNADVTHLVELPEGRGLRVRLGLARRLWRRYDLALVTQESDAAHLYGWVAAPLRSGMVSPRVATSWWKRRLLRHAVTVAGDRGRVHAAAEKLALLVPWTASGDGATSLSPVVPMAPMARMAPMAPTAPAVVPPPGAALPSDLERQLTDRFIVVHVPSMWRYKQWPLAHFERLVAALLDDGLQVVLTGSASPLDRAQVDVVRGRGDAPRLLDVAGRLDLNQLATLLARAALYIGPDTSVTHLAAALQVPVLALFGPTNPMRWGPLSGAVGGEPPYEPRATTPQRVGRVVLMQGTPACVPCGRAGCDDHRDSRSDCLDSLRPDAVIAAARWHLATAATHGAPTVAVAGASDDAVDCRF